MLIQNREGKASTLKDMNRGTVYDGPLAVMVNGTSASASEIVASTLQDYNRAVIIGSPSYGKATGQQFFPVDSTIRDLDNFKSNFGVLKITREKLYRITGKSNQLKGVIPDIHLPDIYEGYDFREAFQKNALSQDSITKKVFYTPLSPLPIRNLSVQSKSRVEKDPSFSAIHNLLVSYRKLMKDYENFPLTLENLREKNKTLNQLSIDFEEAGQKSTTEIEVTNNKDELELLKIDTFKKEINENIKKNIQSDIFIIETYRVVQDLINLSK